jgi:predicted acyltransferase
MTRAVADAQPIDTKGAAGSSAHHGLTPGRGRGKLIFMTAKNASGTAVKRLDSIDQFRGLAILLMVLANFLADKEIVPAWLKHAPDVGLTVIDLIAPFFIFAIGLTYGPSLHRRLARGPSPTPGRAIESRGAEGAFGHFVRRWLAFIGIGAIISAGEIAVGKNASGIGWGVLQAIGAAGLVTLPALLIPARPRALMGLAVLAGYQILLDASWLPIVLASPHGGLHGALAWSGMLIISTAIADDSLKEGAPAWRLPVWSACALAAGVALSAFLPDLAPVSKNRVSASYVLVSIGASGLLFALFRLLVDSLKIRVPLLSGWGKNPLLLYVLHYLLLAFVVLLDAPWWHAGASPAIVILQAVLLIGILGVVAWALDRKGVVLSL